MYIYIVIANKYAANPSSPSFPYTRFLFQSWHCSSVRTVFKNQCGRVHSDVYVEMRRFASQHDLAGPVVPAKWFKSGSPGSQRAATCHLEKSSSQRHGTKSLQTWCVNGNVCVMSRTNPSQSAPFLLLPASGNGSWNRKSGRQGVLLCQSNCSFGAVLWLRCRKSLWKGTWNSTMPVMSPQSTGCPLGAGGQLPTNTLQTFFCMSFRANS